MRQRDLISILLSSQGRISSRVQCRILVPENGAVKGGRGGTHGGAAAGFFVLANRPGAGTAAPVMIFRAANASAA